MIIHDTLQSAGEELPLVSIISPVYNTEAFLPIAIESIINQTYPNWELVFIDDGSTDNSAEIIKRHMLSEPRIRLIQNENHGQGYERNKGLDIANGKYVLFFDSDDFLEDIALDLAVTKLEREKSDFVIFDYYYYKPTGKIKNYSGKDAFFTKKKLVFDECLSLLRLDSMFTQNKIYRMDFLKSNAIKYGEGYIYEDMEFWIKAVLSAKCVSLIHSPLYRLTINPTSSTQTMHDSDRHCRSFILAIESCIKLLDQLKEKGNDRVKYDFVLYIYNKFVFYYTERTPKKLKKTFRHEFVDHLASIEPITDFKERRMLSFLLRHNVFSNKKYCVFRAALLFTSKIKPGAKKSVLKIKNKLKKVRNRFRRISAKFNKRDKTPNYIGTYYAEVKKPLYNDVILFMGFDYRYTGNSRYLYEDLKKRLPANSKVFFVTDSPYVPLEEKIEPRSARMYRFVARAKTIIFESWIPDYMQHRSGSTWFQLWHGTPLKRLMFDSNEKQISGRRPENKSIKFKDIQRWDYLLTDSPEVKSYFKTCFLVPESKQLALGYPRVKYLLDKKNNTEYIDFLKDLYGVSKEKKIVLYLPTWRDCNYSFGAPETCDFDLSYLVDLNQLQNLLGNDYEIVYKDHVFLSKPENVNFKNYSEAETQELLLIADYLLTDYSSVMFDAMAIDLPIVLYCNDFERNETDRGIYEEMWNMLKPFVCNDLLQISNMIAEYKIDEKYLRVKEKFSHKRSNGDLSDFILDISGSTDHSKTDSHK